MTKNFKLAILIDPKDPYPPSDKKALEYLHYISNKMKLPIDFVTKENIDTLKNYSSLFIRTITNQNNYTYQWSLLAEYLNLQIIDTPRGIALGSDKHLQFELCKTRKITIPETQIIFFFDDVSRIEKKLKLTFPLVLKVSNGSFSLGVEKISSIKELKRKIKCLFSTKKHYSLILQKYLYTAYDWRIGILNRKPLFVCKYHMVPNHWQINKYAGNKLVAEGDSETLRIKETPKAVLDCANSVASILDNGLYGLDIKLYKNKAYLIEINDNPNICFGIEDLVETDNIYKQIVLNLCKK